MEYLVITGKQDFNGILFSLIAARVFSESISCMISTPCPMREACAVCIASATWNMRSSGGTNATGTGAATVSATIPPYGFARPVADPGGPAVYDTYRY